LQICALLADTLEAGRASGFSTRSAEDIMIAAKDRAALPAELDLLALKGAAAADLEDIIAFGIALFGEKQALCSVASLRRVFELLDAFPALGRASSVLGAEGRGFVHGQHVVSIAPPIRAS
jgi:plasmid stabilization system protein ParE